MSEEIFWTKRVPSESGWYWLRYGNSVASWTGCVEYDEDGAAVLFEDQWVAVGSIRPNAEWSNRPIPKPSEDNNK